MTAYYAHSSPVGHVFDVATWSPNKARRMGVFALLVGLGFVLVTLLLANPLWLMEPPKSEPMKGLVGAILAAHTSSPWGIGAGMAVTGMFGWMSVSFAVASWRDAGGDYHFRVGAGGISVRVPDGIDWSMCCSTKPRRKQGGWLVPHHPKDAFAVGPALLHADRDCVDSAGGRLHHCRYASPWPTS